MDKDQTPLHIDAEGGQDTPEIAPENKLAYFPLYLGVAGQPVIICGASKDSLAKIRLLLKTSAKITVYDTEFGAEYLRLATIKAIRLETNEPASDAIKAAVFGYIGYEDIQMRRRIRAQFVAAGTPVCLIDDKDNSDFITPAIIDRAPVTIAIGSEGFAPVLVRHLKARIEAIVPLSAGRLARLAGGLRGLATSLSQGAARRQFWTEIFDRIGPDILQNMPPEKQGNALYQAAKDHIEMVQDTNISCPDFVTFVSAGPGDAGMITRDGQVVLHDADIILHDRLVHPSVLELCRREAEFIDVGKRGFGASMPQSSIHDQLITAARTGKKVVRLKGEDAGLFGRLDEEIAALQERGIGFAVVPGVTTASAMAARMGVSLSQRGRNRRVSFCTGYQLGGYAEQDWRQLAEKGAVTAIYMGRKAAGFIQARLLMFGADENMPVTLASAIGWENARLSATRLGGLCHALEEYSDGAPLLILLGLHPHECAQIPLCDLPQTEAIAAPQRAKAGT